MPAGPAQAEAYRRSPTLLAGDSAGSRGEVQVWSPDISAIRRQIRAAGQTIALSLAIGIIVGGIFHNPSIVWSGMALPLIALYITVTALRRPCYITTDDEGIGVTTTKSSRALRWDEIHSFQYDTTGAYWQIKLRSGAELQLNVTGYTLKTRESLRSLIEVNADLYPHPKKKGLLVRRPVALPAGYRDR